MRVSIAIAGSTQLGHTISFTVTPQNKSCVLPVMPRRVRVFAVISVLLLGACSERTTTDQISDPGNVTAPASSFGQIQRQIFDRHCVSCHTTGGSAVQQSGLVLSTGVS